MPTRSHHGCARCKKRRQKCDEKKPQCSRCIDAVTQCEYVVVLKWEGRVPRRPSIRKLKKTRAPKRSLLGPIELSMSDVDSVDVAIPQDLDITPPKQQQPVIYLDAVPMNWSLQIAPSANTFLISQQDLLHHFTTKASMIASHPHIRDLICSQVVPFATQTPSLLYATLALSAISRNSLRDTASPEFVLEADSANLLALSAKHLRGEVQDLRGDVRSTLVHTIRMLTTCEIFSGKADSSWRVHVEGAKAIMEAGSDHDLRSATNGEEEPNGWLASRWFSSIEALSALTARGLRKGQLERRTPYFGPNPPHDCETNEDYYFDVYSGYSSDLNRIFREIGAAAWERRQLTAGRGTLLSEADLQNEAALLESSIHHILDRDARVGLLIPANLNFDAEDHREFAACSRAYLFTALIHVYRRIKCLPTESVEVQTCVSAIIEAVCNILPVKELSPWVLLTTPIYTAGCEALGQDRETIRMLMQSLHETLRIRNILRASTILEKRWSESDSPGSSRADVEDSLDFIPY